MRIKTTARPRLYTLLHDGEVVTSGVLHAGDYMATSLDAVHAEDEGEYLASLAPVRAAFPPLPDSGRVEANVIYQHGDQVVMVRQPHDRGVYGDDPSSYPTLWLVYREDAADVLPWIAGEQVWRGTRRVYDDVTYEAVQDHVTQSDWTPPATLLTLWSVVDDEEPPDEPQPWAPKVYALDDLATHLGRVWLSLMNGNGYEPSKAGTWRDQSDPPMWVAPSGAIGVWNEGDVATHGGQTWRSEIDNNVWAPGEYGWAAI